MVMSLDGVIHTFLILVVDTFSATPLGVIATVTGGSLSGADPPSPHLLCLWNLSERVGGYPPLSPRHGDDIAHRAWKLLIRANRG